MYIHILYTWFKTEAVLINYLRFRTGKFLFHYTYICIHIQMNKKDAAIKCLFCWNLAS